MKRFFRFSVLGLMLLVCNMVGAQEITLDFTSNEGWNFPTEAATNEGSFTKDGFTIKLDVLANHTGYYWMTYKDEHALFIGAGGHIYFPPFDFDVEKFEITTASFARTTYVSLGIGDKEQDRVSVKTKGKVTTVTVDDDLKAVKGQYAMKFNNGAQLASVKVYKATPTAIKEVTTTKADDGIYYTLDGVKVSNPTKKGVYIKNGKKVVL